MKAKIVLAIIVVIVCALIAYRQFRPVFTMAITDEAGAPLPQSISLLEEVTLGNMQQWIQIRGNDISNPVLLWLHGGPGSAQMPISEYNKDLSEEYHRLVIRRIAALLLRNIYGGTCLMQQFWQPEVACLRSLF